MLWDVQEQKAKGMEELNAVLAELGLQTAASGVSHVLLRRHADVCRSLHAVCAGLHAVCHQLQLHRKLTLTHSTENAAGSLPAASVMTSREQQYTEHTSLCLSRPVLTAAPLHWQDAGLLRTLSSIRQLCAGSADPSEGEADGKGRRERRKKKPDTNGAAPAAAQAPVAPATSPAAAAAAQPQPKAEKPQPAAEKPSAAAEKPDAAEEEEAAEVLDAAEVSGGPAAGWQLQISAGSCAVRCTQLAAQLKCKQVAAAAGSWVGHCPVLQLQSTRHAAQKRSAPVWSQKGCQRCSIFMCTLLAGEADAGKEEGSSQKGRQQQRGRRGGCSKGGQGARQEEGQGQRQEPLQPGAWRCLN